MRSLSSFLRPAHCAAAFCLGASISALAAPPVVTNLDVRGLQIGAVNTITFTGTDLLPNPRLLTTARIAKQTVKDGAKPDKITLEVELAPGTQPGFENWWLVTDDGISARGILAIDALPQKPVADKAESLPLAMHGALAGSQSRDVAFAGKAGQEITCEIEAQRLESKVRPVLELYGPGHRLLKFSMPMLELHGDTRLQATLPADGEYHLQLHDLEYAAPSPSHFRLKMGQWSFADAVYPSTVQRGVTTEVRLVSGATEKQTVRMSPNDEASATPAPWADPATASGPQAAVWLSDTPELMEDRKGTEPQALPPLPFALNGRISKPDEADAYELTVEPESEIELQVMAEALGSPIDAELELRDLKGARLAINDDGGNGPDPLLTYKVPKDVTKLVAVVRDVSGQGGPECIYRFTAHVKGREPSSGFSVTAMEDSMTLEPGNARVFKVEAVRAGYEGPIDLAFDHLPEGVRISGQTIPAQATGTLLTLSSDKDCAAAVTALKARGKNGETLAHFDSLQLAQFQPWLASDLAFAGAARPEFAFAAHWGAGAAEKKVTLGGKLTLPISCTRPSGHDGPVRLTLLTSQARRFTRGAVDPNLMLREEKPVLMEEDKNAQTTYNAIAPAEAALAAAQKAAAANKDETAAETMAKKIEAAQAALESAKKAAEEAAKKAANQVEISLVVPAELPEIPHQIALKAELLKRDRRTVEAVAYTSVADLPVVNPIVVDVADPAPVKLDPKTGASLELTGKVERLEGATGDVALTLAGLPPGITGATTATVKNGVADFKFALKIPANFKPGEYPDLKVSATGKPFGVLQVRGRDGTATLKVLAPELPSEAPAVPAPAKP